MGLFKCSPLNSFLTRMVYAMEKKDILCSQMKYLGTGCTMKPDREKHR